MSLRTWLAGAMVVLGVSMAASAQTAVRAKPGGDRLLVVDGDSIRPEPGGQRLLFIDGDSIRPEPGGKRLLFIDGDAVRPEPGGLRVAYFDGATIRRRPGGQILAVYKHPDVRPTADGERLLFIDGAELSRQQLAAVLLRLKPEVFTPTEAEIAEMKREMAEAEKEEAARAAADPVSGKWNILSASGALPKAKVGAGAITVGPKRGDAYPISFEHTAGPAWNGAAVVREFQGDKYLLAAYGTPKTVGLCVYEIKGGTLEGKWYPWSIDGDAKNVGTESLKGPEKLDGEFEITAGKSPGTGAAYTGKVAIRPAAEIGGAADDAAPYLVTWTIGNTKVEGIGIRTKNFLFVAAGAGPEVNISTFKLDGDNMSADWFMRGSNEKGFVTAGKN